METWLPVKDFENLYEISNTDILRSLDRYVKSGYGRQSFKKGKIVKLGYDKNGYRKIILYNGSIKKDWRVHRLVGMHFIPNPENKPFINHKDEDKENNNDWNLEWTTGKENIQHAWKIGLSTNNHSKGEKCNFSKLKKEDVEWIRANYTQKHGESKKLGEKYGITGGNISLIIKNKIWQNL